MNRFPFVSVMIVVRNEQEYIKSAIVSILEQDYPKDRYELLIIDGSSTDNTVINAKQTVNEYLLKDENLQVYFYDNPKELLATGWNIGIRNARGEYIVRIDAHAQADRSMISKSVETFNSLSDVVCVGGRLKTEPLKTDDETISRILSSPFGIGNSKFRYSNVSGYTDTIAYGMYKKEIFDEVGLFNELFCRNQDNEMHGRIKSSGGRFYLNAEIENIYHPRNSLKSLLKQAYSNGKWNIITLFNSKNRKGLSLRHFVPMMFLFANIVLLILSFFIEAAKYLFILMYLLYFLSALYFATKKTKNILKILKMNLYFFVFHICYGAGTLSQFFTKKDKTNEHNENFCKKTNELPLLKKNH